MNPKVAIYARVSTKDQDPEMQLLDLRRYANGSRFEIYHEFIDIGISGTKDSRPALDELMQEARRRRSLL